MTVWRQITTLGVVAGALLAADSAHGQLRNRISRLLSPPAHPTAPAPRPTPATPPRMSSGPNQSHAPNRSNPSSQSQASRQSQVPNQVQGGDPALRQQLAALQKTRDRAIQENDLALLSKTNRMMLDIRTRLGEFAGPPQPLPDIEEPIVRQAQRMPPTRTAPLATPPEGSRPAPARSSARDSEVIGPDINAPVVSGNLLR